MMFYHPQFAGPVNLAISPLPDDSDGATRVTVQWMAAKAAADSSSDLIRAVTRDALHEPVDSFSAVCSAIHHWVKLHVAFVPDRVPALGAGRPANDEVLIRPVDLLRMPRPAGDCDCISMLVAAMLIAARDQFDELGSIDVYFVTVGADWERPREFTHVYVYAVYRGVAIPIDASHGPVAGWEVANRYQKKQIWSVDGVSMLARILGGRGPFLNGLGQDLYGRRRYGVGQTGEQDVIPYDVAVQMTQQGNPPAPDTIITGGPGGPSVWGSILPGIFKTGEQVALQTTRPAGLYTRTGPYGTETFSMPTGGPAAGVSSPFFSAGGGAGFNLSAWLPILLIGGLALFAFRGR